MVNGSHAVGIEVSAAELARVKLWGGVDCADGRGRSGSAAVNTKNIAVGLCLVAWATVGRGPRILNNAVQ